MRKGFSLVEILVALSVFGIFVVLLFGFFQTNRNTYKNIVSNDKAIYLAKEGIEAVRYIRDQNFANLSDGIHGLSTSTNQWTFSGSSNNYYNFVREITISSIDSQTKKIESKVTFDNGSATTTFTLSDYLTYWQQVYISIGNWASTLKDSFLSLTGGLKVDIYGNYAYVITATTLRVYDITNTASPSFITSLTLTGNLKNIFVNGNYAFITSTANAAEVQIVNITTPGSPTLAKTIDLTGNQDANSIFVLGNYAYVARSSGNPNFNVLNVSVIASASSIGSLNTATENLNDVFASGNYAFVATSGNGSELRTINVSSPTAPTSAGTVNLNGGGGVGNNDDATTINGYGNYLYIAQNDLAAPVNSVMFFYNLTTPTSPTLVSQINITGSNINEIAIGNSGQYAFTGTNNASQELTIFDGDALTSLTTLGSYNATTSQSFLGVDYDATLDRVVGVSNYTAEGFIIIKPN